MKKITSFLMTLALSSSVGSLAASCANMDNWNQFQSWINNKDSFLLYIGAENCTYCNAFEKNIIGVRDHNIQQWVDDVNANKNELWENSEQLYRNDIIINQDITDPLGNDYGQPLTNDTINFHYFLDEDHSTIWDNKWASKIVDWLGDQFVEQYKHLYESTIPWSDAILTEKKNTYKDQIKATPLFVFIRNGKYIATYNGFQINNDEVNPTSQQNAVTSWWDDWVKYFVDNSPSEVSETATPNADAAPTT